MSINKHICIYEIFISHEAHLVNVEASNSKQNLLEVSPTPVVVRARKLFFLELFPRDVQPTLHSRMYLLWQRVFGLLEEA
jgi:hypothetical protein